MGYHNHSEIGWVHREHERLMNDALIIGIASPDNFYNEGKVKGRLSRERGIIGQRGSENGFGKLGAVENAKNELSESSDKIDKTNFLSKPVHTELPRMIKKIKAIEIPKSLKGFKHSN